MSQIPVNDASAADLRAHATLVMGLEIPVNMTKAHILTRMMEAGFTGQMIDTAADAGALDPSRPQPTPITTADQAAAAVPEMDPEKPVYAGVRLIMHASPGEGGDSPHPIGINGRHILVLRDGRPSVISIGHYNVLCDAKRREFITNPMTREIIGSREVLAHPFSVLEWLTEPQYRAALAQQARMTAAVA